MKKIILIMAVVIVFLSGCKQSTAVSQVISDKKFTEEYSALETKYVYKYDWFAGEYRLMPEMKTVSYPDQWELEIITTYADGKQKSSWVKVSQEKYESASVGDQWGALTVTSGKE